MSLEIGVVFAAAAVLLFAWGFAQHRRPEPAAWTKKSWLSCAFTLLIVALAPGAVGALASAAVQPAETLATLDPLLGLVALASLALAVWMTPRFIREGRRGTATIVPMPRAPRGGAPTRRAA
jgi:uncharacterized membrane protein